ncbi:MAG: Xaa-Pro peptidase family protein [Symbiobacteriaceae bacterium]|nr:Xaa-Pro peptidase family protein [Symbiobacteriaceae bacterium]
MNERISKLQALMAADNVDAALYATSGNMQYFLGNYSYPWQRTTDTGGGKNAADWHINGHFLNKPDRILYIPVEGDPLLFCSYERLEEMRHIPISKVPCYIPMMGSFLNRVIRGKKRIACGESCYNALISMVRSADNTIVTVDGEHYGEQLRMIKDPGEIAKLRRLAEFTDMSMGIVAKALQPGITPRQVEELIAAIALSKGIQGVSFGPAAIFVRSGTPGSEILFSYDKDDPLTEGTSITFDYGYLIDGYVSDYGRSFYCGHNQQAQDAYAALMEAQLHLLEVLKPGVPMNVSFGILHDKLETHGWGKFLRRAGDFEIMGHQIGIDVHERPWLRSDEETELQPGMVLCIEPKIWWPGLCYLRCEDMVLITETGCESLTKFDRNFFQLP